MKLAELYSESTTIWNRLETIKSDIQSNLQSSSEDFRKEMNETLNELTIEYRVLLSRYVSLVNRINVLNSKVRVLGYGKLTLSEAMEKGKSYVELIEFYSLMLNNLQSPEIASFNVKEVRRVRDGYEASLRKLEVAIEATSWMVEIVPGSPLGETEEADLETVVHMASRVGEYTEEDVVQAVDVAETETTIDSMVEAPTEETPVETPEPEVVKPAKRSNKRSRQEVEESTGAHVVDPTEESSAKERKLLQAALREAQETPREKSPSCPIDSSSYSDYAYSVYKVTQNMGKLAEFLESTQDPTLSGLPVRVLQDFITRNFYANSGEVHVPQL